MNETDSRSDETEIENKLHQTPDVPSLSESRGNKDSITIRGIDYSKQDCIDDLRSLTNEFPDRRVTRDFYRQHADVPESVWSGLFGTFSEFVKAAGLNNSRYHSKVQNKIAAQAAMDGLRPISEERKNYGNLYKRETGGRWKTLIACSDLHDVECDPFYLRVLNETVKNVGPDVICVDGDLFDLPEFGKYNVDPREWDTVGRVKSGLNILKGLREAAPEAQIDLIEGNHEARLVRHLAESSPALLAILSDMHKFDLRKLLGLDAYEVNYIAEGDLCTFTDHQLRKEMVKNYRVYWKCVLAHHFPHGKDKGMPGFNGHHHQHQVWTRHTARMGSYEWHQMGGGHIREASYCDGSKWNNGFLIVNVDTHTESVVFDYVDVGSTFSVAGGTWYYREPGEFYSGLKKELNFRQEGVW